MFCNQTEQEGSMAAHPKTTNRLLGALTKAEFKLISAKMEATPLSFGEPIYEAGEAIKRIYFPESGIISLLSAVDEYSTLEVGIVGSEGLAGVSVFLGVDVSPNRALVQGVGFAQTMTPREFLAICKANTKFSLAVRRFIHSLLAQISQSAVCNRFHVIDERLSRWLLMTQDRMRADEFQITQDFLANMLGVRREAVNKAAGNLQGRGLISYSRGHLTVIDRPGLEAAACHCYKLIRQEYDSDGS
ncbi:MAG: Crp/Fnr family transcriptional regulator [Pyrinomonadaceae bacterium]